MIISNESSSNDEIKETPPERPEKPEAARENQESGSVLSLQKRSKERVFLVIVDDTPEMEVALRFACLRAKNTGGRVALLYVIQPGEVQNWMGIDELIKKEAREDGERILQKHAGLVFELIDQMPVIYLREGDRREELIGLVDEDQSISILVLGASTGKGGPGPLISALTGKFLGKLKIPLTIVPDSLSDEEIALVG